MTDLLDDLAWRGLIHQSTDADRLRQHLSTPGRSVYCGFDPTADSLTIGNLLPITLLARVRAAGHRPVVLFGGATGQIGDPSFKSDERVLLDPAATEANAQRHRRTIGDFLATVDGPDPLYVDNLDWLGPMTLVDYLRDVGKYFSVNDLLRRDSIRSRIEGREQGISYHRVLLRPAAGLRLPPFASGPRRHRAGGGVGPMGQHRGWGRPGAPGARRPCPRPHLPTGHQSRRHQVRKDRDRGGVAERRPNVALRLLPIPDQPRRRPGRHLPSLFLAADPTTRSPASSRRVWPTPVGVWGSGPWPPN